MDMRDPLAVARREMRPGGRLVRAERAGTGALARGRLGTALSGIPFLPVGEVGLTTPGIVPLVAEGRGPS
jgi:hypothetical protein